MSGAGGGILPGKDDPMCVSLLCFCQECNSACLHAAGSCFLLAQEGGEKLVSPASLFS